MTNTQNLLEQTQALISLELKKIEIQKNLKEATSRDEIFLSKTLLDAIEQTEKDLMEAVQN